MSTEVDPFLNNFFLFLSVPPNVETMVTLIQSVPAKALRTLKLVIESIHSIVF